MIEFLFFLTWIYDNEKKRAQKTNGYEKIIETYIWDDMADLVEKMVEDQIKEEENPSCWN